MKKILFIAALVLGSFATKAAAPKLFPGVWQAKLHREDGAQIVFNFDVQTGKNGKQVIYIINAKERMKVDEIRVTKDSAFIKMPFFDNEFKAAFTKHGGLEGLWIRHLADNDVSIRFTAEPRNNVRFKTSEAPKFNVEGRWPTYFFNPNRKDSSFAIGEFQQDKGGIVTGTFLTTSGDYRYLQGVVDGDKLKLSTFDGSHAYLFEATITDENTLKDGIFYAGITAKENFVANKDANAKLPDERTLNTLRPGESKLDFTYPDLNGKKVSINDARYKNKVVIVTVGGSWCPNCMDETAYLTKWYEKNKSRGVEIIALAYERTTDYEKSRKAAEGFAKRFNVTYPVLITQVTPGDPQKTEKTLPQLTGLKGFPTSIFIDKKGNVREVHTGFSGPGTGEHYEEYKRNLDKLVSDLLAE
ncbi:peroxiredoxin [Chitinophaga skermanii]|uniref:Peroxiredoxin n=1 Tax=Chitinophaga skermanii TaxID=331697 RepID=A0A327QCU5_9BACT|nr:TlpA disulfide reductase family protein [Chitinophaga skermanii]RAJ02300.1 peroxiredoxin [Chitinophaga skermanii]